MKMKSLETFMKDIQNYNRPGYTIEVGQGMSPLPIEQFQQIYLDNIGILLGGMTEV